MVREAAEVIQTAALRQNSSSHPESRNFAFHPVYFFPPASRNSALLGKHNGAGRRLSDGWNVAAAADVCGTPDFLETDHEHSTFESVSVDRRV